MPRTPHSACVLPLTRHPAKNDSEITQMTTLETLFWAIAATGLASHGAYMMHHAWKSRRYGFMSVFGFFAGLQVGCLITLLGKLIK